MSDLNEKEMGEVAVQYYHPDRPLESGQWVDGCKAQTVSENFATLVGVFPLRSHGIQELYDGGWEVLHPPIKTRNHKNSIELYEITLKRMVDGL
jgi:hypothetical protein